MDKTQIATINRFGFSITELPGKSIPKMTLWKEDGTEMPGLPADPYHLERYLKRGFLMKPPLQENQEEVIPKRGRPRKKED